MPSAQPDSQAVDQVLHLFPQPVAIIGAVRDGEMGGLTAAWVTRVSVDPALVLVSIGHERHTWHLLEKATRLYREFGFRELPAHPLLPDPTGRQSITMQLSLNNEE